MIDNIYLINLDRRPDRLKSFIKQITKSSILQHYLRISAIDGAYLANPDLVDYVTKQGYNDIIKNKKTRGLYLTRGAVGLAMTYKKILDQCSGVSLLLEDDILVDDNFDSILQKTFQELPNDWDILYLGWYNSDYLISTKISDNVNKLDGQINGTQAWVVNAISAKKIIDMFPITYQIDTELYMNKTLNKYSTTKPIIVRSNLFDSDIQN